MLIRFMIAAILCVSWPSLALPQPFVIVGLGSQKCKVISDMATQPGLRDNLINWMQGFLSGMNQITMMRDNAFKDLGSLTSNAHFEIVLSKCKDDPEKSFWIAIMNLAAML